eukprot:gene2624-3498_t
MSAIATAHMHVLATSTVEAPAARKHRAPPIQHTTVAPIAAAAAARCAGPGHRTAVLP